MAALFNNEYVKDELSIPVNDRALQFGDGLFETIKVEDGEPRLLDYHLDRLKLGAEALYFDLPGHLSANSLRTNVNDLLSKNTFGNHATAKLLVWRKNQNQKAYASADSQVNTLLMLKPGSDPAPKHHVSFSKEVTLHYWKLSQFKTINALPYIMAARERDMRNLDDLILLNVNDEVTECTSSNIFWIKDDITFTPSLKTGCIAGVWRRFLLEHFKRNKIKCKEVEAGKNELLGADAVFSCNSSGISPILSIDNVTFYKSEDLVENLTRVNL